MHSVIQLPQRTPTSSDPMAKARVALLALFAALAVTCGAGASTAAAATVSLSVDVPGTPSAVWSFIGPFCAIKDWLPPVGTCSEDGRQPPTRTLVTKDGSMTFVERETARNDLRHSYTYEFVSSPLPLSHYSATISVASKGNGYSTVTWRGSYTPDAGKADDAKRALTGIYAAGLGSIKVHAAQQLAPVAATRNGR